MGFGRLFRLCLQLLLWAARPARACVGFVPQPPPPKPRRLPKLRGFRRRRAACIYVNFLPLAMADFMANPRKGARSIKEIPPEVLIALESGQIETANLVEWLAINPYTLLKSLLHQQALFSDQKRHVETLMSQAAKGVNARQRHIAEFWYGLHVAYPQRKLLELGKSHASDTVRAWTTYSLIHAPHNSFKSRLEALERWASGPHFGVREVA